MLISIASILIIALFFVACEKAEDSNEFTAIDVTDQLPMPHEFRYYTLYSLTASDTIVIINSNEELEDFCGTEAPEFDFAGKSIVVAAGLSGPFSMIKTDVEEMETPNRYLIDIKMLESMSAMPGTEWVRFFYFSRELKMPLPSFYKQDII